MTFKGMRPVHPGETLKEEFLLPLNMTPCALSKELHLSASRVNEVVKGERGITAETALRLSRYFRTTPQFWMNLQQAYDLKTAEAKALPKIEEEVKPRELETA